MSSSELGKWDGREDVTIQEKQPKFCLGLVTSSLLSSPPPPPPLLALSLSLSVAEPNKTNGQVKNQIYILSGDFC